MDDRTALESLLRRDRWLIGGALAVTIALCWAWIRAHGPRHVRPDDRSGGLDDDGRGISPSSLLFAMWVVMMAGMMLPSAAPTLFLYAGVIEKVRKATGRRPTFMRLRAVTPCGRRSASSPPCCSASCRTWCCDTHDGSARTARWAARC